MDDRRLEVNIYQIVDDSMMKANRADGTGWDWCWADWQRSWMNATPQRYAYRCLPLTIVNQTGWWIKNPVGFTATWRGGTHPGTIEFHFDAAGEVWSQWINSQFGEGIITWNTPFLFRTKPRGSRLLVCGPVNYFKVNAHPLTALIESDWVSMSFTMNYKLMIPNLPVRFEVGEPLFQAIPLVSNVCSDLEGASVSFQRLADDPELAAPTMSGTRAAANSTSRRRGRGQAGWLAAGLLPGPRRRRPHGRDGPHDQGAAAAGHLRARSAPEPLTRRRDERPRSARRDCPAGRDAGAARGRGPASRNRVGRGRAVRDGQAPRGYQTRQIEGWAVLDQQRIPQGPAASWPTAPSGCWRSSSTRSRRVVPPEALSKLRRIRIWVEEKEPDPPA